MKRLELVRQLEQTGCVLVRHGVLWSGCTRPPRDARRLAEFIHALSEAGINLAEEAAE